MPDSYSNVPFLDLLKEIEKLSAELERRYSFWVDNYEHVEDLVDGESE